MSPTENRLDAVLFDFAGTLFVPEPAARQVALAAAALGLALSPEECERLGARFEAAGMPGAPYPAAVPETLRALYAKRDLGPDAHRAAYTALMSTVPAPRGLAAAVYERILLAEGWVPYEDSRRTIGALLDGRVAVGLISNVGFDLRPILIAHGMGRLAAHATLSFEHGLTKPSPELFGRALADLGATAARTLMVGDHPVADGGAAALGMRTLILPMSAPGARHGLDQVLEAVRGNGVMQGLEHFSNPSASLDAVLAAPLSPSAPNVSVGQQAVQGRQRFGNGAVLRAVRAVMESTKEPVSVAEVHAMVQARLGETVSTESVRSCLVRDARGPNARLVRVSQGRYRSARL